jgi:RecA/RadA recombinase
MNKPFDLSKLRKTLTKSITGLSIGFNDPTTWIDTGNHSLNYLISGDFFKGIPLGKVSMLAGESGSGKSLLAANVIKHAQDMGIYVILIDTENALDESWLRAFDIETDESKILKLNMAMVDDVAKTITEFIKEYKEIPEEDRPKVLFIIDSLGMLLVNAQVEQFERGELKGDFGHKPKALKALITNCVNMFGNLGIGLLATNHTYSSQNIFSPDDVISGGSGPIFAASILVAMKKGKLKEDEDGGKITEVAGIRAMCKVMKTRYNKPFEGTELKIPYAGGLDRYSGLFELFEGHGMLTKNGNRYSYVSLNGDKINLFKKEWYKNTNDCLTVVMSDIMSKPGGLFKPDFDMPAINGPEQREAFDEEQVSDLSEEN